MVVFEAIDFWSDPVFGLTAKPSFTHPRHTELFTLP